MPSNVLRTLALVFFTGILVSVLAGTIMPFLVTAAAVWGGYHVARGLYG